MTLDEKYQKLQDILRNCGSMIVAFSGGVDSTLLVKTAHDVLGDRMCALTAAAPFFPSWEKAEADEFCKREGIPHRTISYDVLNVEGVKENPYNRCYLCKKNLFAALQKEALKDGFAVVVEGTNTDDLSDYRPGLQAIRELGIRSPLCEAGLGKQDIRDLSRQLNLPTWDKPSFACLASRFPYGDRITVEKLKMVEQAETLLLGFGFRQVRVRIHGTLARIELLPEEFSRIMEEKIRQEVIEKLYAYGFSYITLDLQGFRSGSMNEQLKKKRNCEKQADESAI
jgi:uncharacterized protein